MTEYLSTLDDVILGMNGAALRAAQERLAAARAAVATATKAWDESLHPREPAGSDEGGQFTSGGGGGGTEAMRALVGRIDQPDGGFSVHPLTRESPTTGYMVSIYPDRSKSLPVRDVTASTLMQYLVDNRDLFQQPAHFFGAWHDPETHQVWLDISVHTDTAAAAEALAQQHTQLAYFIWRPGPLCRLPPREGSMPAVKLHLGQYKELPTVEEIATLLAALTGKPPTPEDLAEAARIRAEAMRQS